VRKEEGDRKRNDHAPRKEEGAPTVQHQLFEEEQRHITAGTCTFLATSNILIPMTPHHIEGKAFCGTFSWIYPCCTMRFWSDRNQRF